MRFPRKSSINRHADFIRVRKSGQSKAGRFVILSTLADAELPSIQAAFITSKRVSKKAHERNLLRRRLRSYVQAHTPDFVDTKRFLVTIARADAKNASNAELEADWLRQARRLGLFAKEDQKRFPNE